MFVFIKALCAASVFFFFFLNFVWIISVLISEDHSGSISSWLNCKYCMRRTQTLMWRTRPFEKHSLHQSPLLQTQSRYLSVYLNKKAQGFHKCILYSTSHSISSLFALCVCLNVKHFFKDHLNHCMPTHTHEEIKSYTGVRLSSF